MKIEKIVKLAVFVLLVSCNSKKESVDNDLALPIVTLKKVDTTIQTEFTTNIEAKKNVEIRSHISGFIENIHFDEGARVHKGQILFQINQEEYQSQVQKAQANLSSAKAEARVAEVEVKRVQLLTEKNIVSATELDLAKLKHETYKTKIIEARAMLDHARLMLSYTIVRSPFDGIVNTIPMKIGSRIEDGTLLTSISDISEMYAYFHISENQYLDIHKTNNTNSYKNLTVNLVLSDGTVYKSEGTIETTNSEFEDNTGTIAFRAKFPNADNLLKHGATGKILIPKAYKDVFVIPIKSVYEIQDKNYVYVVSKDNKAHMLNIKPIDRLQSLYIVKSGVKHGDRIVYEGLHQVQEGMTVMAYSDKKPTPALLAKQ